MDEKRISELMKTLNATREEVIEMLQEDKEIDRGAKLYELPDDLKAGAKKARQADRKANAKPRERKPDEDKRFLIDYLIKALVNEVHCDLTEVVSVNAQGIEVTNPEREFTFEYNGRKYRLTLAVPRT